jgi:hypothetical protein
MTSVPSLASSSSPSVSAPSPARPPAPQVEAVSEGSGGPSGPERPSRSAGVANADTSYTTAHKPDASQPSRGGTKKADKASFVDPTRKGDASPTQASQAGGKTAAAAALPKQSGGSKPEEEWRKQARAIHDTLGIDGPCTDLTPADRDRAIQSAANLNGLDGEYLHNVALHETHGAQNPPPGPAQGLMQIETKPHPDAFSGDVHAGNDTISNVAYGAKEYAKASKAIDDAFQHEGLEPPTGRTKTVLTDLMYNRGPDVAKDVARRAREQGIDPNRLDEYFAGKNGRIDVSKDRSSRYHMTATPAPGETGVDSAGRGSVLDLALLDRGYKQKETPDVNGDGRRDHFDIWIGRTGQMLESLHDESQTASCDPTPKT